MSQDSRPLRTATAVDEQDGQPLRVALVRARQRGLAARLQPPVYVWFMLPGLVLYVMFFIIPLLSALRLSFYDWPGIGTKMNFIGLTNFANALADPDIYRALGHNAVFFIMVFVLQNTVGLGLALLLNARLPGHQVHRTLLYLPSILSLVVTGFLWELMLSPQIGFINPLLGALHLAGLEQVWLGDPTISLPVVVLVQAWAWMGLPMVVYLAGLQSIPRELIEAAVIDGATALQTLLRVTVPLLVAPFTTLTVFCFIAMFRVFDIVYVLEGPLGPPDGTTTTLGTVMLEYAFGDLGGGATEIPHMSYAMAVGLLSFLLLGVVSTVVLVTLRRREVEFG